jgi:AcrR family transcriptional regulator
MRTTMPDRSEPQQTRSRDKLDRILAAAAGLLAELAYQEVSTRLIAERAGVSVGSLYRYFPDRDSIAEALLAGWLEDLMNTFRQSDPPSQAGSFVEQAIDTYAEVFRRVPGFRQVFYAAPRSRELERQQRKSDDDLADLLYDVLTARYGLPADGLAVRCLVAVRVADHLVGLAFRDEPDGDHRLLGEAKTMICRYLGA